MLSAKLRARLQTNEDSFLQIDEVEFRDNGRALLDVFLSDQPRAYEVD